MLHDYRQQLHFGSLIKLFDHYTLFLRSAKILYFNQKIDNSVYRIDKIKSLAISAWHYPTSKHISTPLYFVEDGESILYFEFFFLYLIH